MRCCLLLGHGLVIGPYVDRNNCEPSMTKPEIRLWFLVAASALAFVTLGQWLQSGFERRSDLSKSVRVHHKHHGFDLFSFVEEFWVTPTQNQGRLAAVSNGLAGFDPEEWKNNFEESSRRDQEAKLFKTCKVVGMPVDDVHKLLGAALNPTTDRFSDDTAADTRPGYTYESFHFCGWKCGYSNLHFEFKNGKVTRYRLSSNGAFGPWTSDNNPPEMR